MLYRDMIKVKFTFQQNNLPPFLSAWMKHNNVHESGYYVCKDHLHFSGLKYEKRKSTNVKK